MKLWLWLVIVACLSAASARDASAAAACTGGEGWSPAASVELPPRARVVFWRNDPHQPAPTKLVATIDGKSVATKQTALAAAPFQLVVIDIDSDRTGKLVLAWDVRGTEAYKATFTVTKRWTRPKTVTATVARYHAKIPHSTVREVFDGLAIQIVAPAVLAHVKLRRDANATWTELDVPVVDLAGNQLAAGADGAGYALRIGELGCKQSYSVALLEQGVDIDVEATLVDGSRIHVDGLSHVVLAKRAKPTSTVPSDAE